MSDNKTPNRDTGSKKRKKKLNPNTKEKYKNYYLNDLEDDDGFINSNHKTKKGKNYLPYDLEDEYDY